MRAIIQRVSSASVTIDGKVTGSIETGYLILLGVSKTDTDEEARKLWGKVSKLRLFSDEEGKTNLSIHDIGGSVLVVSQFTLYANCKKGNRPSFTDAGLPDEANRLYEVFLALARTDLGDAYVAHGSFGAEMQVELVNNGPFTILLDTDTL